MDQTEVQALFRKFAAPLTNYAATSALRQELAETVARSLWLAVIGGPEMEEVTWNVFQDQAGLDDEAVQPIQEIYYEQMKPVLTEAQIAELRTKCQSQEKE